MARRCLPRADLPLIFVFNSLLSCILPPLSGRLPMERSDLMSSSSHPDIASAALIVLGRRKGSQYCGGWFTLDDKQPVHLAAVNAGYYVLKLEQVPPEAAHWVQRGVVKPDGTLTLLAIARDVYDKLAGADNLAPSSPSVSAPELQFSSDAGVATNVTVASSAKKMSQVATLPVTQNSDSDLVLPIMSQLTTSGSAGSGEIAREQIVGVVSERINASTDPVTRIALWNSLKDGDVVLAAELGRKDVIEGYWPAVITHVDAAGRYTLRWRDDDRYPHFKLYQRHLALFHADA